MSLTSKGEHSSEWGFKGKCQLEWLDINWHGFGSRALSKSHTCSSPPGTAESSSFSCSGLRRWQQELGLHVAEQSLMTPWCDPTPGWEQIKAPDRGWSPNPQSSFGLILRLWNMVKNIWKILSNCPRKCTQLFTFGQGRKEFAILNLPSGLIKCFVGCVE